MSENYLGVSNTGALADFENNTPPMPFNKVDGLDTNSLERVADFKFLNPEWLEKIDKKILDYRHINQSFAQPESICGTDERALINPQIVPYRYICSLAIVDQQGGGWIGSGFFISPRCVITSGHCVFIQNRGGWVRSITVYPGRDGGTAPFGSQVSQNFRSVTGWTQQNNSDFDHGAIILPDNTLFNRIGGYFGYSELNASIMLNNSGYPSDRPTGTQWFNAGAPTAVKDYKIEYMIDTVGGQSGSPVFINSNGRSVIGVHGYGGCPNACIRVRDYIFQRWGEWTRL